MGSNNSSEYEREEPGQRRQRRGAARQQQNHNAVSRKLREEREENYRLQVELLNKQILINQLKTQSDLPKAQNIQTNQKKGQQNLHEEIIRKTCPNTRFGCTSSVPNRELLAHSKACLYRLYTCPMKPCSWRGNYSQLYCHVEAMHPYYTEMRFGQLHQMLLGSNEMILTSEGLVFKFYARPTQSRLAMCWTLQLLGPQSEATNWKYQIHINKKGDNIRRLQLSDMCLHEDEDVDQILEEGSCPSAAFKMLENYLQNNRVGLKLNIMYNKGQSRQP